MIVSKLQELLERAEAYFQDEIESYVLTKDELMISFIYERYAFQFVSENENFKCGFKVPYFENIEFTIKDRIVIMNTKKIKKA